MNKKSVVKIAALFLSMALVAGIYTFIVIPSVRKEEKKEYKKLLEGQTEYYINVLTYSGDTPLLESTVITENLEEYFSVVQMPAISATSDYVADFNDILGLQLQYTICSGQQVSFSNFKEFLKNGNGDRKLKEFKINSLVAGQALPGRFVDILLRYTDGSCAVVVPKIQIYDIAAYGEAEIVFALSDEEYNDLINACKEGTLDIRVYLSDKQQPSVKTYSPRRLPAVHNGA